MCCVNRPKDTKKVQQRTKPFRAYKIVCPQGRYDVSSLIGTHSWGPGTHKAHSNKREYDSCDPHGIHFFFRKPEIDSSYARRGRFVLVVTIDPKDIIATGSPSPFREGVALKATVTKHAWNTLRQQLRLWNDRYLCKD